MTLLKLTHLHLSAWFYEVISRWQIFKLNMFYKKLRISFSLFKIKWRSFNLKPPKWHSRFWSICTRRHFFYKQLGLKMAENITCIISNLRYFFFNIKWLQVSSGHWFESGSRVEQFSFWKKYTYFPSYKSCWVTATVLMNRS